MENVNNFNEDFQKCPYHNQQLNIQNNGDYHQSAITKIGTASMTILKKILIMMKN